MHIVEDKTEGQAEVKQPAPNKPARKWYNSYFFSLIPLFEVKPATNKSTRYWAFNWLLLKVWNIDASTMIEFNFTLSSESGIGVNGSLPFIRFVFAIPIPRKWHVWCMMNVWRKIKRVTPQVPIETKINAVNPQEN